MVNRAHGKSVAQKFVFFLGHLTIILFCIWLALFHGWESIGSFFAKDFVLIDSGRAKLLLTCAVFYFIRQAVTLFYLLQRKVDWSEVFGLLAFFAFFEVGLLLIGGGTFRDYTIPLGYLDLFALALLLLGSYLNTYSEIQRKWWKQSPENKGHCYTEGLFSVATHINFFGDTILFVGWCLFTVNLWALGLPLFMAGTFVFFHIPNLDRYLATRYGKEFVDYATQTKKFIPYIY